MTVNLTGRLDLSAFDAAFHNNMKGAPAYSLAIMLKIIFYCYSRGIIASRPIEYACKTNIIVKALARDAEPDHDTIARFISSRDGVVKDLFAQVLLKCYALGLIGGGTVRHRRLQAAGEKDLSGAAFSCVYDKEYQDKHLERIEKKLKYINTFPETAEGREGACGEEVKSNITDNGSAKIAGPHGYIQGTTG